ncbi:hypothetical protein EST55_06150 [Idiomarina sp. 29L]|uniref:hypothetical protein n=1 Tax=Idiomarina sp. 29L TaxID=2508877 RepID=UPI00101399E7|nr:hypothetical protein [Idiomarina sp. 29L]RXS43315.1 hypothetical protein EST55_06150 [Idiomarina sp. 29L]
MRIVYAGLLFLFLQSFAHAAQQEYLECNDCVTSGYETKVTQWGTQNIEPFESGQQFQVTVIDLTNTRAKSFMVSKQAMNSPSKPTRYIVSISETAVPLAVNNRLSSLKASLQVLKSNAAATTIPTNVIKNAWEFTNCAYCKNVTQQYLRNTLNSSLTSAVTSVSELAQAFDLVNTNILNRYRVNFENGGYVLIELTMNSNPHEVLIHIVEVVDKDLNTVPLDKSKLEDLSVRVTELSHADTINSFISKFQLHISRRTGVVRIRPCADCDEKPDDDE